MFVVLLLVWQFPSLLLPPSICLTFVHSKRTRDGNSWKLDVFVLTAEFIYFRREFVPTLWPFLFLDQHIGKNILKDEVMTWDWAPAAGACGPALLNAVCCSCSVKPCHLARADVTERDDFGTHRKFHQSPRGDPWWTEILYSWLLRTFSPAPRQLLALYF